LNERLFLEAELPFFMLDTKNYPTTVQGKFCRLFFFQEFCPIFVGDAIEIACQLFKKYRPSLNDIYLPRSSAEQNIEFKHYFN
jgi:hypothetical protein